MDATDASTAHHCALTPCLWCGLLIDGPTCAHVRLPLWGDCLHPSTLKRTVQPHRVAQEPALADAAAEAKQRVMDASPTLKYLLGPHGTCLEPVRAHWVLLREALFPVILNTRVDRAYARGQFPIAVQIACPCRSAYVCIDAAPCAHADTATPESTPHAGSGAGAGVPAAMESTQAEGVDRPSIAAGRAPDAVASRVCAQWHCAFAATFAHAPRLDVRELLHAGRTQFATIAERMK